MKPDEVQKLNKLKLRLEEVIASLSIPGLQELTEDINQANEGLNKLMALAKQISLGTDSAILAVEKVRTDIAAHVATLHELWSGLEEAHATAKGTGEAALTNIKDQVDVLRDQFESLSTDIQSQIEDTVSEMMSSLTEELLEPVNAFRTECVEKIDEMVTEVVDEILPEKAAEVTEEWLTEVREELTEMIADVRTHLDEFRRMILDGKVKAGVSRSTAAEAEEVLRTVFDPVINELERIRSLAGMVGISI